MLEEDPEAEPAFLLEAEDESDLLDAEDDDDPLLLEADKDASEVPVRDRRSSRSADPRLVDLDDSLEDEEVEPLLDPLLLPLLEPLPLPLPLPLALPLPKRALDPEQGLHFPGLCSTRVFLEEADELEEVEIDPDLLLLDPDPDELEDVEFEPDLLLREPELEPFELRDPLPSPSISSQHGRSLSSMP